MNFILRNKVLILFCILLPYSSINAQNSFRGNQEGGYAYIKGKIQDLKKYHRYKDYLTITYFNRAIKSPEQYHFKTDSIGHFFVSIYLLNAQDITLSYNGDFYTLFLFPNDTAKVIINDHDLITKNPEDDLLHTYYEVSKLFYKEDTLNRSNLNFNLYKEYEQTLFIKKSEQNKSFIDSYNGSDFFNKWLRNEATLHYYFALSNYPFSRSDINEIQSLISELIDTISANYNTYKYNSSYSLLFYNLTELVYKYIIYEGSCVNFLKQRKPTNGLSAENSKMDNHVPSIQELNNEVYYCFANSLGFIDDNVLKEQIITNKFLNLYERGSLDLPIDSVLALLTDTIVIESFMRQFEEINYSKSMNTNLIISDNNEGRNLLENIEGKYPDHVVCFIFWATWCKPCYNHIKDLEAKKYMLEGKKVAFVYLCCQSKDNVWKEKVNQLNVTGEHYCLTNEQYAFLAERYNIRGVPKIVIYTKSKGYKVLSNFDVINSINQMLF